MADQPSFTRIPNDIIEAMPTLGNAELRVLLAIARKTVGWQKECDVISVSQISTMTGLTSRNAQQAIMALLGKGLIARESSGKQSYCYTLQTISPRDTVDDHIPSEPISPRDTEPHPLGTRLEAEPYPLGITQKKDSKEKKERDVTRATRTPQQSNMDAFNPAILAYKELSGKKHITPALATLIATRVSDIEKWRATIQGWDACGFNIGNVNDMLDWYDHPERMAQRLSRNSSKNIPPAIKSTGPPVASKPNIAPDVLTPEERAEMARKYRNGLATRTTAE